MVNLQNKLKIMCPSERVPNIGQKYKDCRNLWMNDYLMNVKNILAYKDVDFDLSFDQGQLSLKDINHLFTDQIQRTQFYKQAKFDSMNRYPVAKLAGRLLPEEPNKTP